MLKKKNIAMVMAAATVATSVAPVFAAVTNTTVTQNDIEKVISEVQGLLNTRYSSTKVTGEPALTGHGTTTSGSTVEAHLNSVYKITATVEGGGAQTITNTSQLRNILENANIERKTVTITVIDKGHETVNNQIVGEIEYKSGSRYLATDLAGLVLSNPNADVITKIESNIATGYDQDGIKAGDRIVLTLINGKEIVLDANKSAKLDFGKPVDANGNVVNLTGATAEIKKSVVGFKEAAQVSTDEMYDIPETKVSEIKVVSGDVAQKELLAKDLYADGGLTEKGSALFAFLNQDTANGAELISGNTFKVKVNGTYYAVTHDAAGTANDLSDITKDESGYKFSIDVVVADPTNVENTKKNVTLTIKGDDQSDLLRLRNAIIESDSKTNRDLALKKDVTLIAGEDRFKTAVSISKTSYPTSGGKTLAESIILVGENAVVDGLAVAPLASQTKAPILLTAKDKLNSSTKAEIERLIDGATTVDTIYVVGGKDVISSDVENELREYGITIKRLAGADRMSTSIEIAKELVKEKGASNLGNDVFVVGADGEADAMSIASKAAELKAPIVVTAANGLSDAAKVLIKDSNNVDVIGGEGKVSTQVLKDIKDNSATTTVERVAGLTRHETNAQVTTKYYTANSVTNVYVAKDGYGVGQESKLIDALAVAPLAGTNQAPIVLASAEVTKEQVKAIETVASASTSNLFQVGRGIASSVINSIADKMKLN